MIVKLALRLLKNKRLKEEDKLLILNALLERISAIPIKSIITFDKDGTLNINGKTLTVEQTIAVKEGANSIKLNHTYKLIKDQIAFEAIKMGIHSSLSLDMVIFCKAALWLQQEEQKLIERLSGEID